MRYTNMTLFGNKTTGYLGVYSPFLSSLYGYIGNGNPPEDPGKCPPMSPLMGSCYPVPDTGRRKLLHPHCGMDADGPIRRWCGGLGGLPGQAAKWPRRARHGRVTAPAGLPGAGYRGSVAGVSQPPVGGHPRSGQDGPQDSVSLKSDPILTPPVSQTVLTLLGMVYPR